MIDMAAHRVLFNCQATTALTLPTHTGPALRGALFRALRLHVCALHGANRAGGIEWLPGCPICDLMAPEDRQADRGKDVTRLFVIEPPLHPEGLHPPEWPFSFSVTLFGSAAALFPFLAVAVQTMGQMGLHAQAGAPGRFAVRECWADDPYLGKRERIMEAQATTLHTPTLPITHTSITTRAESLLRRLPRTPDGQRLLIRFLTPARLIEGGHLADDLRFSLVLRRSLRRISDMCEVQESPPPALDYAALLASSEAVRTVSKDAHWVDLASHSRRTGRTIPIGGFLGSLTVAGDLAPFLPWLIWGEITHIGKDTTKGNGWYRLE